MELDIDIPNMHVCPAANACAQLRDMIKTTWAWAEANSKLFRHAINGAEYVKVPVDELERVITEKGEGMQHRMEAEFEDPNWSILDGQEEKEQATMQAPGDPNLTAALPGW